MRRARFWAALSFAAWLCLPVAAGGPDDKPGATAARAIPGLTTPSRKALLAVPQTGRIKELVAREGQYVAAGDLIAVLDDDAQQTRVLLAKLKAECSLKIELGRVEYERAVGVLERLEQLRGESLAAAHEIRQAQADADSARLRWSLAQSEQQLDRQDFVLQSQLLDLLRLRAPFAGYVAEQHKEVGETVEAREAIVTLALLDPLTVVADCPLELARFVRPGASVTVRPADDQWPSRSASVTLASQVADPASQTLRLKLDVSNPDNVWIAGMKVLVEFPSGPTAAASGAPTACGVGP
ncbi:MAG: efflux RND transporter periplasmic adaptor subunit [Phycisphaerae bacterium]